MPIVTIAPRQVLLSPNSRLPRNVGAAVERQRAQPGQQVELQHREVHQSGGDHRQREPQQLQHHVITQVPQSMIGSTVVSLITVTVTEELMDCTYGSFDRWSR